MNQEKPINPFKFPPKLAHYPWNDYFMAIYPVLTPELPAEFERLTKASQEDYRVLQDYLEKSLNHMKKAATVLREKHEKLQSQRGVNQVYYQSLRKALMEYERSDILHYLLPIFFIGESSFSDHLYDQAHELLRRNHLAKEFSSLIKIKAHSSVRKEGRFQTVMESLQKNPDLLRIFEKEFNRRKTESMVNVDFNLQEIFAELLLQELARRDPKGIKPIVEWLLIVNQRQESWGAKPTAFSDLLKTKITPPESSPERLELLQKKLSAADFKQLKNTLQNFWNLSKYRDRFQEEYYRYFWIELTVHSELRAISGKSSKEIILEN